MRPTTSYPRTLRVTLALTAVVGLSACSSPAEETMAAIATGVDAEIGAIEVRSLLLVASAEGEPARFLGTLVNSGDEAADVVLMDDDDTVTVPVPAGGQATFDTSETIIATADDRPGSRVPVTVQVTGEGEELSVPIVDGTLEQYEPYVPDAA